MFIRSVLIALSFLPCQIAYAAGAACFNYETFAHPVPPPMGANQALIDYMYGTIQARSAAIPALAVGVHQIGVSLKSGVVPPWNHNVFPLVGGALTLQEASLMARDRQNIGINIRFQQPNIIFLLAAGLPVPMVAAMLGIPVAAVANYANSALNRGGYLTPLSTAIYRLRHNLIPPNFVAVPPGMIADRVILQIHIPVRASKNLKELSVNSILAPALPGMAPYVSVKDMIDVQFAVLGIPPPHSATIVSSDSLQPN